MWWVSKLGFLNSFIVFVLVSRLFAHIWLPKLKAFPALQNVYKKSMKYHRVLAIILVITGFVHGFLMLGGIRFHSGWVLYAVLIFGAYNGYLYRVNKAPILLSAHKIIAAGAVGLLFNHVLIKWF